MELIGSPWQFPVFLMVISAPPVTRSQACSRPSSGYPVVCWYGIAIALHTASLAARVYASGGDSNMYQRLAYTDLTRPVRNAELLASVLSYCLGRKAAFLCVRLWPTMLRETILETRVGQSLRSR